MAELIVIMGAGDISNVEKIQKTIKNYEIK